MTGQVRLAPAVTQVFFDRWCTPCIGGPPQLELRTRTERKRSASGALAEGKRVVVRDSPTPGAQVAMAAIAGLMQPRVTGVGKTGPPPGRVIDAA